MPILLTTTKRILYIHVPKTGGSYVEDLLRSYGRLLGVRFGEGFDGLPCSPQHFHAPLLHHVYSADRWEAHDAFDFVFMTVREPISRMKSEFRYRVLTDRRGQRSIRLGLSIRFDGWLSRTIRAYRRNQFLFDNHIRPQHEFEAFGAKVFHLEDGLDRLRTVLDDVTGLRGTAPKKPVNRSSNHASFDYTLSGKTHSRFLRHAMHDYERFGYPVPAIS